MFWTGNGDGTNWDHPQNWDTGRLPGLADDVVINPTLNATIVHRSGLDTIKSLQTSPPLVLSGGTLQVTGGVSLSSTLTISGGTKSEDAALAGWTKSVAAGDILGFNVDSASGISRVTVVLVVTVA